MGILDKVQKEKKREVTYVQVQVPAELHAEVSKILSDRKISWQKALMTAIQMMADEAKKKA